MTNTADTTPPNELEYRRAVLAATEDLSDMLQKMGERVVELHDLNVPAEEWLDVVGRHAPPFVHMILHRWGSMVSGAIDAYLDARKAEAKGGSDGIMAAAAGMIERAVRPRGFPVTAGENADEAAVDDDVHYTFSGTRIKQVLKRLFDEAPKMTDGAGNPIAGQAPALQCNLLLKSGGQITGALSTTPEGTLRMLCPNDRGGKPVMIEHFFDYEEVADVAIIREVNSGSGSGIITS